MPQERDPWERDPWEQPVGEEVKATPKGLSWSDVPGKAWENAGPSILKLVTSLVNPETYSGLGKLAVGASRAAAMQPKFTESDAMFQGALKSYADRYGSAEGFKKSIAEDPAGVLADIATAFSGAGTVLKAGGLARAGNVASKIGAAADPLATVGMVGKKLIPKTLPERIYTPVLKPGSKITKDRVGEIFQAAVKENVLPTEAGASKTQKIINNLDAQWMGAIERDPRGNLIYMETKPLAQGLDQLKRDFETVLPKEAIKDIEAMQKEFVDSHGKFISTGKALHLKRRTYAVLEAAYESLKGQHPLKTEGPMELASGIRQKMIEIYPEMEALGFNEGVMVDLKKAIDNSVNKALRQPVLPVEVGFASYGLSANNPQMAAIGVAKFLSKNAHVAGKLAIALERARRAGFKRGPVGATLGTAGAVADAVGVQAPIPPEQ